MKGNVKIREVQIEFSHAIIRRDKVCQIRDFEPCYGRLECSHFHTQGSTPSLMFYPFNAYAQCSKHHFNHHNKKEDKLMYYNYLLANHPEELVYMESVKNNYIKYTQDVKKDILYFCKTDRLDELAEYIKELL